MRALTWGTIFVCASALPAYSEQSAPTTVPVGTVVAQKQPIAQTLDFVGRVEAINRVDIRARVKGYLEAVLFKEGDLVKEGAALYRIEKGLFQAAVDQAQGALETSKAQHDLYVKNRKRQEELTAKNVGTAVALDEATAHEQEAKGQITTNEGNLQTAQINLGYTDITSPIAGKIGRTSLTKGNVVGPDSGVLVTIVSQDPMYVTFPMSQREFLRSAETGHPTDVKTIKVQIRFSDGTMYKEVGEINFIDVTVNQATDTVIVRATMPNPNGALIDGELVRVNLESGTPDERIVIPQSALIADQEGTYVFVVEDGKAAVKRVKPGGDRGTNVIIESGLAGGEQVIVDGLQGVRPGIAVRASPLPQAAQKG
jgi:membrane fusion protein (multidrug efflux system)